MSVCLVLCMQLKVGCGGGGYISEHPHKDRRLSQQWDYEGGIHSTEGKRWIKMGGGGQK